MIGPILTHDDCNYSFDDTEERYTDALLRDATRGNAKKLNFGSLVYMAKIGGKPNTSERDRQNTYTSQSETTQLDDVSHGPNFEKAAESPTFWLTELNRRYAWAEKQQSIYRFDFDDFTEPHKLHSKYENELVNVGTDEKPKLIPKSRAWMSHPDRREHRDVVFDPSERRITSENCINMWTGTEVKPLQGDIGPYMQLLEHMFPAPLDRTYILQWLAFKLKHPGNKMNTSLLVWSRKQGVGKNLLFECVKDVIGSKHSQTITQSDLKRDFNGWLKNKVLVIGDEVLTSDRRKETDQLKFLITGTTVTINEKHQPEYSVSNFASFVFLSNHGDAIHIDKDDRRFFVHEVTAEPLEQDFYKRFVEWRDNTGLAALHFHLLNKVDINGFDPTAPAPITEAKLQMIGESQSALEEWITDVICDPIGNIGAEVASTKKLLDVYLARYPSQNPSPTAMTKAAQKAGAQKRTHQIRTLKDGKVRVLSLKNHDEWARRSSKEWVEEYAKIGQNRL